MRTTITINDDLLAALKERAFQRGSTVSRLIEEAVRLALSRETQKGRRQPAFKLVVYGAGAAPPAVNLDKVARLIEEDDRTRMKRRE